MCFTLILIIALIVGAFLLNKYHSRESFYQVPAMAPVGNNQISQHIQDAKPFQDDRSLHTTRAPLGDSYNPDITPLPQGQQYPSGCLLGCNSCSPLCSGEGNRCGIVAPIPSGVWQPQSASTVQYRLKTGNYVPSYCPQGRLVLQKARGCEGALDYNASRDSYTTTCQTAQRE